MIFGRDIVERRSLILAVSNLLYFIVLWTPRKRNSYKLLREILWCVLKLDFTDFDRLQIAVNKYQGEMRARGVPGKLVTLFSAFGHTVLSAINYSNPFSSPKC